MGSEWIFRDPEIGWGGDIIQLVQDRYRW
jgi:hypothetical protein